MGWQGRRGRAATAGRASGGGPAAHRSVIGIICTTTRNSAYGSLHPGVGLGSRSRPWLMMWYGFRGVLNLSIATTSPNAGPDGALRPNRG